MIRRSADVRSVAAEGFPEQRRDTCWSPTPTPGSRWEGCPDPADPEGGACRLAPAFQPWWKTLFVAILRACYPSR